MKSESGEVVTIILISLFVGLGLVEYSKWRQETPKMVGTVVVPEQGKPVYYDIEGKEIKRETK